MRRFGTRKNWNGWATALVVATSLVLISSCTYTAREVVRHKDAGDDAYRRGNYTEAEREYQVAIRKAESISRTDGLTLICMRSLAQVYIAQSRHGEAETIYRQRVELLKQSPKDPSYGATVYDDLATFYILRGRFEEAEPLYEQAIALTKIAYGDTDPKVSEKVEYFVQLLKATNREAEASQLQAEQLQHRPDERR